MTSTFVTIFRIENCARCGGTHDNLVAKPFEIPVKSECAADIEFTHWTMCPATQDPILIAVTDNHPEYSQAVELRHNQRINSGEVA